LRLPSVARLPDLRQHVLERSQFGVGEGEPGFKLGVAFRGRQGSGGRREPGQRRCLLVGIILHSFAKANRCSWPGGGRGYVYELQQVQQTAAARVAALYPIDIIVFYA